MGIEWPWHPHEGTPHCRVCGFCGGLTEVAPGEYEHLSRDNCIEAMKDEFSEAYRQCQGQGQGEWSDKRPSERGDYWVWQEGWPCARRCHLYPYGDGIWYADIYAPHYGNLYLSDSHPGNYYWHPYYQPPPPTSTPTPTAQGQAAKP